MSGRIPDVVRNRTDKIGFATPEREWFMGVMRPLIEDKLNALKKRSLVPFETIQKQWMGFSA